MLPGFRFLFGAIVLSMSVLVFGLGAAALLRAAHEEFANVPSRRAPPARVFAPRSAPPRQPAADRGAAAGRPGGRGEGPEQRPSDDRAAGARRRGHAAGRAREA